MDVARRMIRENWGWLIIAALVASASCSREGQEADQAPFHDTGREILGDPQAVVAVVDGDPVTLAEVELVVRFWLESRAGELQGTRSRKELQQRALTQIIDQILLSHEAERHKICVADSAVDGMTEAWGEHFAAPEEREAKLAENHLTPEMVRTSMRRELLVRELVRREIRDTVQVSDDEQRAYYQAHPEVFDTTQVRASHILFEVQAGATADEVLAIQTRAKEVLALVKSGGDFAALAREHSDCKSREQGGDLGFCTRRQWLKPFADAAFALAPGETSDLVGSTVGFHIIKVTEIKEDGWHPYSEHVMAYIRALLVDRVVQSTADRLAKRLRTETRVDVRI
ncbi:MAG: peptidylprolyl isomerase [Candidatus Eisenbacteria sp.]|nr:peptidylprolyl isomerase [Candidatus Eisenbacteria bacterium]